MNVNLIAEKKPDSNINGIENVDSNIFMNQEKTSTIENTKSEDEDILDNDLENVMGKYV